MAADEIIIETTSQEVIEVGVVGPQGPAGAAGPQGPAGAGGVTSVALASSDFAITGSPITSSGTITANIASNAVTLEKLQTISSQHLLGRHGSGNGGVQQIGLGTGLAMNGSNVGITFGTTTGTAAAGDDSRITGAAQTSANLSDLASSSTARTNLGLGSADSVTFGSIQNTPIGSTTRNTGAFTTLNATNGTLTASAPVLSLAQTWNNASVAFTGMQFNVTNTASLSAGAGSSKFFEINVDGVPAIRFQRNFSTPVLYFANTDTGIGAGSTTLNIYANGGAMASFGSGSGGMNLRSDAPYSWASATTVSSSNDLSLFRDAADTLAQRRTTNPQAFRIYNTFTDASNYERGFMRWSSNVLQIGAEAGGTGSNRNVEFVVAGNTRLTLSATTAAVLATTYRVGNGGDYQFGGAGVRITGTSSGAQNITFQTNSTDRLVVNDTLLGFGGVTSSFPALKRSSTTLQVRLADDSGYTVLDAQLRAQGTAPATSGATGTAGDIRYDADYIYVCTAANTWKRAAIATW